LRMSATLGHRRETSAFLDRPLLARIVIVLALVAGTLSGLAIGMQAAPATDLKLVHLLRAMAVLKLGFVAVATGAVWWRLQAPVRPVWLAGYAVISASMAAGPALIWFVEPHHSRIGPAARRRGCLRVPAMARQRYRRPPARYRDPQALLIPAKTIAGPRRPS
jgi:hypothetical protein